MEHDEFVYYADLEKTNITRNMPLNPITLDGDADYIVNNTNSISLWHKIIFKNLLLIISM